MKKFSRLLVKLSFLFAGSDCMMPHVVQVLSMFFIMVDFLGTLEYIIIVDLNMNKIIS